jgi:hypothetical protein
MSCPNLYDVKYSDLQFITVAEDESFLLDLRDISQFLRLGAQRPELDFTILVDADPCSGKMSTLAFSLLRQDELD